MSVRFPIVLHRLRWLVDGAAVAIVLAATLRPAGTAEGTGWVVCLWCGRRALAEILRNIVLFMPLGATLAWRGVPRVPALAAGLAFSFVVETLQLWIPGRSSSLGDLTYNLIGTGVGWWLARTGARHLAPPPERAARWSVGAAVAAAMVIGTTGLLLQPARLAPRPATPWRLRTPAPQGVEVHAVELGIQRLRTGPLPPDTPERWVADEPLTLTLVARQRRVAFAPALTFEDARGRAWLSVGLGWDVVVWRRTRATGLELDEPDLRWPNLLRRVASGDTVTLVLERHGSRACLIVRGERHCSAPAIGSGWALLLYPERFPAWFRHGLSGAWLAMWFLPLGLWARRRRPSVAAAAIGAGALVLVPWWQGLLPLGPHELAGVVTGLATGRITARTAARYRARQ